MRLNDGSLPEMKVPRYDKSAYDGKGDRADEATWPSIKAPVDVVLFEGWMLGFTPVSDEMAGKVDLPYRGQFCIAQNSSRIVLFGCCSAI